MRTNVLRAVIAFATGALLLAACGGQPADDTAGPTTSLSPDVAACSAAGMDTSEFTENPDLTGAANETRRAIVDAAVACDFERLAELAQPDFTYSFGDSGAPADYWRTLEDEGTPVLRYLVTLLGLDADVDESAGSAEGTVYTWPRAYRSPDDAAARRALEEAFGADVVGDWYTPSGEYLGWRVGIAGDGDWRFFVSGD